MGWSRRTAATMACLAFARAPSAAAAPTDSELATARQLFAEGVALEDARDWRAALERFRRVAAIKSTPQVHYNLGVCLANTGHLVEADSEIGPLVSLSGDKSSVELAALARQKLAQLRARIPRVLVKLSPDADAEVTLDGDPVSPALLGTPILVDPGPHVLVAARRSGRGRLEERLVAVEGEKGPLVATFDFPTDAAAVPLGRASSETPAPRKSIPVAAIVSGGATAAVLSAALAFALLRSAAISDLDAKCGPGRQYCPGNLHGKVSDVGTYTVAADVLGLLGLAGAATTASLFFFLPAAGPSPHSGSAFGVAAAGRF